MFLYDVTRLIARSGAETPTGIDRVDMEYASFALKHKVRFIAQSGDVFRVVPEKVARDFLSDLALRWGGDITKDCTYLKKYLLLNLKDKRPKTASESVFKRLKKDVSDLRVQTPHTRREKVTRFLNERLEILPSKVRFFLPKWLAKFSLIHCPALAHWFLTIVEAIFDKSNNRMVAGNESVSDQQALSEFRFLGVSESALTYLNVSHHGYGHEKRFLWLLAQLPHCKMAFLFHDLIPLTHSEYVREGDEITFEQRLRVANKFADHIFVISEYTKNAYESEVKRLDIYRSEIKVEVLYNGISDIFFRELQIPVSDFVGSIIAKTNSDYFLMLSTLEPRKNQLLLVNLWRAAAERGDDYIPYLILVGKDGWCNENLKAVLNRGRFLEKVIVLEGLVDDDLVCLIKNAKATLFPSFVEGWGLPVVESASVGTPVIASDIPVLREAGQDLLEYIPLSDTALWWQKIVEYGTSESPARLAQVARLDDFKAPAWSDTLKKLEMVLCR